MSKQEQRRQAFRDRGGHFRAEVTAHGAWLVTARDGRHHGTGTGRGQDLGDTIDAAITAAEGLWPVELRA